MAKFLEEQPADRRTEKKPPPVKTPKEVKYKQDRNEKKDLKAVHLFIREDLFAQFKWYCETEKLTLKQGITRLIYDGVVRPKLQEHTGKDVPFDESPYSIDFREPLPLRNRFLPKDHPKNR